MIPFHGQIVIRRRFSFQWFRSRATFLSHCQQSRSVASVHEEKGERESAVLCRAKCLVEMTYNCCLSGPVRSQLLHSRKRSCSISGRGTSPSRRSLRHSRWQRAHEGSRVWDGKQPFRENNSPGVSSAPPCYISLRPAIQTFQRGDYSPECQCLFLTYAALRRRGRRQERLLLVAIFLFSGALGTSWHSKFLPARTGGLLVQPSVSRALRQPIPGYPLQRVHSHFNRIPWWRCRVLLSALPGSSGYTNT